MNSIDAGAGETGPITRHDPPELKFSAMSQAVRRGRTVMISGQVALKDGKVVGVGDAAVQVRQCFANVGAALGAAGASLTDIVSLRCYLTRREDYPAYAAIREELFKATPPCSTTVIVSGLVLPDLLIEVEAVAWTGSDPPTR